MLEGRNIQTPIHQAAFSLFIADLDIHDGLIGPADLVQARFDLLRDGSQHLFQIASNQVLGGAAQDGLGGAIAEGDPVLHIHGDDPAGNGGEHVVHQILQSGHFSQSLAQGGEQAGIFDGKGSLVGKRGQQIPSRIAECAGADAVIGVDHPDDVILDFEGYAQDRA